MAGLARVSLFLTCAADLLYPSAARACVQVLEGLGVAVDFPQEQTCCGQPWLNTGHGNEARRLAGRLLNCFENAPAVVAPSASCVDTIRNGLPQFFAHEPALAARLAALGERTYEFCEFLHRVLRVERLPRLREQPRTTYHSSCRTLRGLRLQGVAETYLTEVLGDAFVPLPEADSCCGFGGSFSVKLPEISGRLLSDKLRNIASTGAAVVASLDLSCLTHLSGGARRQGLPLRFVHVARILAEAFGASA